MFFTDPASATLHGTQACRSTGRPGRCRVVLHALLAWAVLVSLLVGTSLEGTAQRRRPGPASHFRAAQLTWSKTGATTASFEATFSARRSFYGGPPNVGNGIAGPDVAFGDGNNMANVPFTVVFVDAINDVLIAEASFDHVYASAGPFTVAMTDCCRLSDPLHINNPDGNIRTETIVDFAQTTASPVSSLPPIVDCPLSGVCSFNVPAVDPDAQGLRFRLATAAEAGGSFVQPGPPQAPNPAAIDQTTGFYSWNTTGATQNPSGDSFYSTQVIVENVVNSTIVSKIAVDFFIRLTSDPNQAPAFVSPTPADGTTFNTNVGSTVSFQVAASDADVGDTVTLGVIGKPASATFNPTAGNPATGTFSWTPTAVGDAVMNFTAQDQHGRGATPVSIVIHVEQAQDRVRAWGKNVEGQLGTGVRPRQPPIEVQGLSGVQAVAGGGGHSLALKTDGTVWAWGLNDHGQLGDGTTTNSSVPLQVKGPGGAGFLTGVASIAAGGKRSFALKTDGTVWAWGGNVGGLLGDGTTQDRSTPVQVKGPDGVGFLNGVTTLAVSAGGFHNLALRSNGDVLAWGQNAAGQLGTGQSRGSSVPVRVKGLDGVGNLTDGIAIAAGRQHSLVVRNGGSVVAFGRGKDGRLGNGKTANSRVPVAVKGVGGVGTLGSIVDVAAGGDFSLARKSDGTLLAWGLNQEGQLGDGTNESRKFPVGVSGISDASDVVAGGFHAMAMNAAGTVKTWGRNQEGQLGDTTTANRNQPGVVAGLSGAKAISAGYWHSLAVAPGNGGGGRPAERSPKKGR